MNPVTSFAAKECTRNDLREGFSEGMKAADDDEQFIWSIICKPSNSIGGGVTSHRSAIAAIQLGRLLRRWRNPLLQRIGAASL
jgi:hypothetical protein